MHSTLLGIVWNRRGVNRLRGQQRYAQSQETIVSWDVMLQRTPTHVYLGGCLPSLHSSPFPSQLFFSQNMTLLFVLPFPCQIIEKYCFWQPELLLSSHSVLPLHHTSSRSLFLLCFLGMREYIESMLFSLKRHHGFPSQE